MKIKEGGVMDIQKLTKDQAVVISGFTGILCGEFSDFHTDVEKRLGRGVQTFEFGSKEFAAEVKKLYEADFIGMGTVDTEAAKAQAVPEWKDYELEKPNDGQKCLVIFESRDCEDAQRWMCIDEFNEGMFDFIANWEDQCASVAGWKA